MKTTIFCALLLWSVTTTAPCLAQTTGVDPLEFDEFEFFDSDPTFLDELMDLLRKQLEQTNSIKPTIAAQLESNNQRRGRGLKNQPRGLKSKSSSSSGKKSKGKGCELIREASEDPACSPLNMDADLPFCAGVRGNGARIFSHFAVLARLVEDFGPLDGISGGSSGAITLLIHDAIVSSDLVTNCPGDVCCTYDEQNARISFLLRSFESITETFFPVMIAASALVIPQILQKINDKNILGNLLSFDPKKQEKGLRDFLKLLDKTVDEAPFIKTFLNPQVAQAIIGSPNPIGMAEDIISGLDQIFDSRSPLILVRPSILNWEGVAELFDVLASFLHGSEPVNVDGMQLMLSQCAVLGDTSWTQSASRLVWIGLPVPVTCQEIFTALLAEFVFTRDSKDPSYIKNKIGKNIPTTVSTGVMTKDAYEEWDELNDRYLSSLTFPVDTSDWNPPFEDVRFGYFGDKESLKRAKEVVGAGKLYDDPKSEKFLALGDANWKQVIMTSAAEPSLSSAVPIGKKEVSVGGWVDFGPAQVLAGMGCDRSILITRQDGTGSYSQGLMALMGATPAEVDLQYDFTVAESAWSISADLATGTVCTDWDGPSGTDFAAIAGDGLTAPFLHTDACFEALDGPAGSTDQIEGCTPAYEETHGAP
mmetsp:Transcript_29784/g.43911  ORF Transcript_29784/g.43911 Transcript_29784/m.43911 type:complete len:648 (-) Transcript_29784:99-2042(-)|eukprot:CAMPEP_0194048856 /NCGR_PEP_ID=MMETSP0009_2-20130614/28781_1 /TAXON_ID=210454 /ORGANISM="Grammatophora oceanica, Strain CCMP 410" /LENGTH=647 /DNA_ID=CAMNT_0038694863 /DNA_START=70 /DNA_END=2013 /DNA_ORIENTATION=+